VLAELAAHQAALQALAWSHDGALLASASVQGTVIRVHRLPSANKVGVVSKACVMNSSSAMNEPTCSLYKRVL
jgi:hypothetical protein